MSAFRWRDDAAASVGPLLVADRGDEVHRVRAYARAVWSCLVEPGDGVAGALIATLGPVHALQVAMSVAGGAAGAGVSREQLQQGRERWRPRLVAEAIAFALETAAGTGIHLICPEDDVWPSALDDLGPHAPVCLWVRGDPARLRQLDPAVAIVGARAASGYGEQIASEFAAALTGRGITVVSGAAYGIDGAAHRGALSAGGMTVALLAGGVDRPYPAGHSDLIDRIARTGAVIGELPCGNAPTKWRFLQRNRLIAALGSATVVVEAGARSGSLNTAGHAADLGRALAAVPGPVTSGSSAGCHRLLREFDARCVTTADEVAELLGMGNAQDGMLAGPWTGDDTRLADALSGRAWRDVDDLARRSGMAPDEIRSRLGLLALTGAVEGDGFRWRRAASRRTR
ncbi:DNA-processing protein DprA [Microbacterium terrisoli]|uniref:DNA-processing protein DprA n=1 Tax=Microbacterium terrisoli TaxID=3242192 RepID=UPI0028053912|nr:DNA-processing protein DprA [Microbacterium protaetiae]